MTLEDTMTGRRVTVSAAAWDGDEVTHWDFRDFDSTWSEKNIPTEKAERRLDGDLP